MPVSDTLSSQIINQAWTKAVSLSADLESRLDAAQTAISSTTGLTVTTPTPLGTITEPTVDIPLEAQGPDLTLFNSYNNAIFDKLVAALAGYITEYFPADAATFAAAEAWLYDEIVNGGSGVNATIEAQVWERDRSRIVGDATRAADEAVAMWAGKRFPIPTGALQYQTMQIQQKMQDELAKSSRETAIKAWEMEKEMVKFAIENALKARQIALTTAGDYIKALASSQNMAYQLVMGKSQAQNGLIQAAAAFYNARTNAMDVVQKSKLANAQIDADVGKANLSSSTHLITKRADVAVAAADAVAREAAAMLNNLHTSVGVQGTEKL